MGGGGDLVGKLQAEEPARAGRVLVGPGRPSGDDQQDAMAVRNGFTQPTLQQRMGGVQIVSVEVDGQVRHDLSSGDPAIPTAVKRMRRKGRSGASHRRGLGTKRTGGGHGRRFALRRRSRARSEEHTSDLQSLMRTSYAVIYLTKKN